MLNFLKQITSVCGMGPTSSLFEAQTKLMSQDLSKFCDREMDEHKQALEKIDKELNFRDLFI